MYQVPTGLSAPYKCRLLRSGAAVELEIRSMTIRRPAGAGKCLSLGETPSAQLTLSAGAGLKEGDTVICQVGDGTNWVPLGVFTIQTASGNDGLYTYTGADVMGTVMEKMWQKTACTTVFQVLESIARQCGVTFSSQGLTDLTLTKAPEAGCSCRELAGYMAALLGGNAVIDRLGRLTVLVWQLDKANTHITADEIYSGEENISSDSYTTRTISCTVERTVTVTEGELTTTQTVSEKLEAGVSGAAGIAISNPYMTQSALNAAYARLAGRAYYAGSVGILDHWELDPGDVITAEDRGGNAYLLPVMELEWSLDGGLKTKVQSFAQSEGELEVSYSGPTTQVLERMTADLASFKQLYVQNLQAEKGWFDSILTNDLNAVTVNASKYLTGVTIIGDVIKANTLTADKLILTGSDGLIYEINAVAGGLTAAQLTDKQYQSALSGSVLVANSITADKINVTDLFAQDITASGTIRGVALVGATGDFTGSVTASKGTIGAWAINSQGFYGNGYINATNGTDSVTIDDGMLAANSLVRGERIVLSYSGGRLSVYNSTAGGAGTVITPDGVTVGNTAIAPDGVTVSGALFASGVTTLGNYLKLNGSNYQIIHTLADGSIRQLVGSDRDRWVLGYYDASGTWVRNLIAALPDGTVQVPNGVTTSSDERLKTDWTNLDQYDGFFDDLTPAAYRYVGGDGRRHIGFGAQSVESALEANDLTHDDFAGLVKSAPLSGEDWAEEYGLIYTEFTALNTAQIQKLKKRVNELEERVERLEAALSKLGV